MKTRFLLSLALLALVACDKDGSALFTRGITQNDTDMLREYIATYPEGEKVASAREVIDEIEWKRAASANTPESYADYMKVHPDGIYVNEANRLHKELLFKIAEASDALEDWKNYMAVHDGKGKRADHARHRIEVLSYAERIQWTPLVMGRTNMQNDPRGEENGSSFTTTLSNSGDREISMLKLAMALWPKEGSEALRVYPWYAIVPKGAMPGWHPEESYKALAPGESRELRWTLGDTEIEDLPDWPKTSEALRIQVSDMWVADGAKAEK
jgi:hypothetical protein